MSSFNCTCGYITNTHTIDTSKNGGLLWDEEQKKVDQLVEQDLTDYSNALDNKNEAEWIKSFYGKDHPESISLAECAQDIVDKHTLEYIHSVYVCPNCQRMYVSNKMADELKWTCYKPETN